MKRGICDAFDPNDIQESDMQIIANSLEEYLNQLEDVMIIPEDIIDDCKKRLDNSIAIVKKLIKKLRKGDTSVFKDSDEWNSLA